MHNVFAKRGELPFGFLLLLEGAFEQTDIRLKIERFRESNSRCVGGHLVMLDLLRSSDDADVEQLIAEILLQRFIGFGDQAGHGWAAPAFAFELMLLEDFFEAFGVFLSLLRVPFKSLRQFRGGN